MLRRLRKARSHIESKKAQTGRWQRGERLPVTTEVLFTPLPLARSPMFGSIDSDGRFTTRPSYLFEDCRQIVLVKNWTSRKLKNLHHQQQQDGAFISSSCPAMTIAGANHQLVIVSPVKQTKPKMVLEERGPYQVSSKFCAYKNARIVI
jgi:hypothetical protein